VNSSLSDAALVLIGHGSSRSSASAAPVYQHAAELRRREVFGQVVEAFWKQEPAIRSVLAGVRQPRVFILPFLMSEGYFADEAIPRELGLRQDKQAVFPRVQQRAGQTLYYCSPIGTQVGMAKVILARAQEVIARHPFPFAPKPTDIALFIVGHGTGRHDQSRKVVEQQVSLIAAQRAFAEVHAVFMEEEPRVGDCYGLAQARNLVVVPFLASDGPHATEDIPILLGEAQRIVQQRLAQGQPAWRNPTERKGKLLWYGRSVGTEPHLADVILEMVREMASAT
jgi:sirohydrochlorin cobaltochelatase